MHGVYPFATAKQIKMACIVLIKVRSNKYIRKKKSKAVIHGGSFPLAGFIHLRFVLFVEHNQRALCSLLYRWIAFVTEHSLEFGVGAGKQ